MGRPVGALRRAAPLRVVLARAALLSAALLGAPAHAGQAIVPAAPDGRFLTQASVEGVEVEAEVAPGKERVLVPTAVARRAGVKFDRRKGERVTLLGRDILAFPTRIAEVRLAGVVAVNVPALVVDDLRVRRVSLGRPFLEQMGAVTRRDGALVLEQQ